MGKNYSVRPPTQLRPQTLSPTPPCPWAVSNTYPEGWTAFLQSSLACAYIAAFLSAGHSVPSPTGLWASRAGFFLFVSFKIVKTAQHIITAHIILPTNFILSLKIYRKHDFKYLHLWSSLEKLRWKLKTFTEKKMYVHIPKTECWDLPLIFHLVSRTLATKPLPSRILEVSSKECNHHKTKSQRCRPWAFRNTTMKIILQGSRKAKHLTLALRASNQLVNIILNFCMTVHLKNGP